MIHQSAISWLSKFGASALVVGVPLFTADAQAFFRQMANTDCQPVLGASNYTDENTSTTSSVVLSCSFVEDEDFDRVGRFVEITVRDANSSTFVSASRCEDFYTAVSGRCATPVNSGGSFTGISHLTPGTAGSGFTVWNSPFDSFAYLQVILPQKQSSTSAGNRVQGYFWQ